MLLALALSCAHNTPLADLFALDLVGYANDARRQLRIGFGARFLILQINPAAQCDPTANDSDDNPVARNREIPVKRGGHSQLDLLVALLLEARQEKVPIRRPCHAHTRLPKLTLIEIMFHRKPLASAQV
jgi:hypothetical protein